MTPFPNQKQGETLSISTRWWNNPAASNVEQPHRLVPQTQVNHEFHHNH